MAFLPRRVLDLVYAAVEVCTQDIHLVDECHTRYVVGISLTPYVLGLRLNTALCTENADSAVQYTQGTLNLNSEVNVAWSINDVDTVLQSACLGLRHCSCRVQWQVVAAEVIVIPLSCSCSIQSMVAVPS